MEAGKLKQRIAIQKRTITYNTYHEPIETWVHGFFMWSEAITSGGGEYYAAQKLYAETKVVFKIRLVTNISVLDRIIWNDHTYQILGLNEVNGLNRTLLIATKEVT